MTTIKCLFPFTYVEMTKNGIFPCCTAWTKSGSLGSVKQKSLMDIWNGEEFQYLREKMYKNELKEICDNKNCPFMLSGSMIDLDNLDKSKHVISDDVLDDIRNKRTRLSAGPSRLTLSDSGACNLRCIMCGSGRNYINEDSEISKRTMEEMIKNLPFLKEIRLTGDGDPFFREDTRKFLETFDPVRYPDIRFIILTNGQLLTRKMWDRVRHNNISQIWVSVDAATKKTYEKIRVGGKWERLMENLEMVSNVRKTEGIKFFEINMTVMRSNYTELIDFLHLGEKLGCDQVAIQRFYGHMPEKENVFTPPDKKVLLSLKDMLRDPVFRKVKVWMDGIADVEGYNPSIWDNINYESFYLLNSFKRLYDRYIAWRFKKTIKYEN